MNKLIYRGRLAPSPTGFLHLGHARTFWIAQQRAQDRGGTLVLRNDDLNPTRSKPEFATAMMEDLNWFGLQWQEGPDCGGRFGPYQQSQRGPFYLAAFRKLQAGGFLYPCICSRQDVRDALQAPHAGDEEPIYPGTCRPHSKSKTQYSISDASNMAPRMNWRFHVCDEETLSFDDGAMGPQRFVAGKDFGDFVVWRHDGVPAYQLAATVDDHAMGISEVVRGADLLLSTARQILLYRALHLPQPKFYHCTLMTDEFGVRLAKRHDALSLRTLRKQGASPQQLRASWQAR